VRDLLVLLIKFVVVSWMSIKYKFGRMNEHLLHNRNESEIQIMKYKNNVNGRLSRSDISYIIMLISYEQYRGARSPS